MTIMTLSLIIGALLLACAGGVVFLMATRSGHFDDLEDVKYQMFQREDDLD
jgi:cbb3-type cytochrome oxidase maturation protein